MGGGPLNPKTFLLESRLCLELRTWKRDAVEKMKLPGRGPLGMFPKNETKVSQRVRARRKYPNLTHVASEIVWQFLSMTQSVDILMTVPIRLADVPWLSFGSWCHDVLSLLLSSRANCFQSIAERLWFSAIHFYFLERLICIHCKGTWWDVFMCVSCLLVPGEYWIKNPFNWKKRKITVVCDGEFLFFFYCCSRQSCGIADDNVVDWRCYILDKRIRYMLVFSSNYLSYVIERTWNSLNSDRQRLLWTYPGVRPSAVNIETLGKKQTRLINSMCFEPGMLFIVKLPLSSFR